MVDHAGTGANDRSGLSESLTALGQFVLSEQSLQESLQRVAALSVRAVYGADGAGVTWVVTGRPTTVTAAGDFVRRIDEIQYSLDEGPCLSAFATQQVVLVENLAADQRWPRFAPAALGHGRRGLMAAPLTVRGDRLGALNVYALQADVLDEAAAMTAALFAVQASIVLGNAGLNRSTGSGSSPRSPGSVPCTRVPSCENTPAPNTAAPPSMPWCW